jgi:hypothetical protein
MIFYLLSFLSGFFEIGPMTMILRFAGNTTPSGTPGGITGYWDAVSRPAVLPALGAVLCYQLGNLIPRPFKLSRPAAIASAALAVPGFALFALRGDPEPVWLLLPAVFFCSAAIQAIRGEMKTPARQMYKRLFRILGFAGGFFCSPPLAVAGAVILPAVVLWDFFCRRHDAKLFPARERPIELSSFRFGLLDRVMIFHQMHFFTYCYVIIIASRQIGGTWTAIAVFLPGWFSYTLSEKIYRRNAGRTCKKNRKEPGPGQDAVLWQRFFIFGHSLLVVLLLGLYLVSSLKIKILLWILTGLGGTTVFCIKKLKEEWQGDITVTGSGESQAVSENLGHVLGTLCCILVCMAGGRLFYVFPLSAVFVCITIMMMLISIRWHKNVIRRKG